MAQTSKKEFVIEAALPLFLQHGFKGTSIDLVVKTCGVSKPTVYNHFPDKAALMLEVVKYWIDSQLPKIVGADKNEEFEFLIRSWLSDDTVSLYALVIGEGRRFPEAKQLFWQEFDQNWRKILLNSSGADLSGQREGELNLDHQLLMRLKQI